MTIQVIRPAAIVAFLLAITALTPHIGLAQRVLNQTVWQGSSGATRGVRRVSRQPQLDTTPTDISPSDISSSQRRSPPETLPLEIVDDETTFAEADWFGYSSSTYSLWTKAEYLLWWSKGAKVPPLVTTGPTTESGALGEAGTSLLYGDMLLNRDVRSGGRLTLGWMPWDNPTRSIEVNYLGLEQESSSFAAANPAGLVLARPFFNVQPATGDARQDSQLISSPSNLAGVVNVDADTDFQSAEVMLRQLLIERPCYSLDFMMGYRFTQLDDALMISENLTVTGGGQGQAVGTTISLYDQFDTRNDFHGANLGFAASYQQPGWSVDLLMKLAFGSTRTVTTINGQTMTNVPNVGASSNAGGLLAMPSNIGTYQADHFTAIPELGATFRYQISPRVSASIGYSLIYWSKIARASEQIDLDVNPTQLPPGPFAGAPRPEFNLTTTDFWAQGINFGLECFF